MGDYLLELSANPRARKVIKKLGLPITLPQKLNRTQAPWEERPLKDAMVLVWHNDAAEMVDPLAAILPAAGANVFLAGSAKQLKAYEKNGEKFGRIPQAAADNAGTPYAMILDGTGIKSPGELFGLYEFFHNNVKKISASGRTIILSRPPEQLKSPAAAAAARAMEGFNRAMAREIGKKGITAQLVLVDRGAEDRLEACLRFLLSARSAYINAQNIHLSKAVGLPKENPYERPLSGKTALVTGAARGIGAAIARSLAREGAHVICMDLENASDPVSRLAGSIGGTVLLADITSEEAPDILIKLLDEKFGGRIDIIIHNAGITRDKMLTNMKPEQWNMALNVNLISLMRLNEALLPRLNENGRIVCLSSMVGISGNLGQTNYCASKAGLIGYVKGMAAECARKNIAINAVAPGFIETRMTAAIPVVNREFGRRLCNLAQGGLPEDIAETVTFLASPGAAGLSGEVIRICGGNYFGA